MYEDNINLSSNPNEVDWKKTLVSLYMRQGATEDGKIFLPIHGDERLSNGLGYTICKYIHLN